MEECAAHLPLVPGRAERVENAPTEPGHVAGARAYQPSSYRGFFALSLATGTVASPLTRGEKKLSFFMCSSTRKANL